MKQLELDFNSINLSDHYDAYRVIDKGKNQICNWSDSLSDDGKKISYNEYTYNTNQCMDFENWIHVNKNGLGKSAFKWFFMYLTRDDCSNPLNDVKHFQKRILNVQRAQPAQHVLILRTLLVLD